MVDICLEKVQERPLRKDGGFDYNDPPLINHTPAWCCIYTTSSAILTVTAPKENDDCSDFVILYLIVSIHQQHFVEQKANQVSGVSFAQISCWSYLPIYEKLFLYTATTKQKQIQQSAYNPFLLKNFDIFAVFYFYKLIFDNK